MTTTDNPGRLSPNIKRWRAFALSAAAFFMTVIELTIVNVSLPTARCLPS